MTVPRIFHLSPVSGSDRQLFEALCPPGIALDMVERADDPDWGERLAHADAAITGGHILTVEEIARAPRLRAVQMRGVGWQDRVPAEALRERGIRLATCPAGSAQAVAEHTLMLILAVQRHLIVADASIHAGRYRHADPALRETCHRLSGATVGLVGMGQIGQAVARLLVPFGVRGLYHSHVSLDRASEAALHFQSVSLAQLLAESDAVSLHVPGGPATRHLIGASELARMKPGAILINTARGSLVDHAALAGALQSGRLGGAGLDVFDPEPPVPDDPLFAPIFAHPNVIVTPHVASAQFETFAEKVAFCLDNLARFLAGGPLEHEVAV